MPLFSYDIASGIADRVAAIGQLFHNAAVAARVASAPGDLFRRTTLANVYEVERDFATPLFAFEGNLSGSTILGANAETAAIIAALDLHCSKQGAQSFDVFCFNSGLQVSEYFADVHLKVKGSPMRAHNVFSERDVRLAATTKVGAGNWTFAAGSDLGSGGQTTYAKGTQTGEQLVIAVLPSGITTSNCAMSVSGLDDAGHIQQAAFSFPNGLANAHALVSPTVKFRTITNVAVVTDTGITNASVVTFVNKRERVITL